jgi:hypothetical protein
MHAGPQELLLGLVRAFDLPVNGAEKGFDGVENGADGGIVVPHFLIYGGSFGPLEVAVPLFVYAPGEVPKAGYTYFEGGGRAFCGHDGGSRVDNRSYRITTLSHRKG